MAATRVRGKSRSGVECGLPDMTWPPGLSASSLAAGPVSILSWKEKGPTGRAYPSLWMDMLLIIAGGREREVFLNCVPTGKVPVLP